MMSSKKLLVPLDGSAVAEQALDYVPRLQACGGTITLLSVIDPVTARLPSQIPYNRTRTQYEERRVYLTKQARALSKHCPEVSIQVEIGSPATVIITQSRHYNMLVLTAHGWSDHTVKRYSDIVQQILDHASCKGAGVPVDRFASLEIHDPKTAAV